jgi:hypothetical protein
LGYLAGVGRALIGHPVALPEKIARKYPELTSVKLRRGGLFPRIAGWTLGQSSVSAITLWRTVFFGSHASLNAKLLLHEFRHAEQFLERRSFPLRYIWESLRRGYHHNRYEIDARAYAASRVANAARIDAEEV